MDPAVFLDSQIYEIDVVDAAVDSDGQTKADAEVYSKVRRIVSVTRNPAAGPFCQSTGRKKKKARGKSGSALQRRVF
jgi:hypothetical protein